MTRRGWKYMPNIVFDPHVSIIYWQKSRVASGFLCIETQEEWAKDNLSSMCRKRRMSLREVIIMNDV